MLPTAHRIRTAAEFQQTTRRGIKVSRGRAVIYVDTSNSVGPTRLGVIANSAVGGSVVRHRVTRRIRGAVAAVLPDLPSGTRIVVRALPGAGSEALLPQHVLSAITTALARQ